VENEHQDIVEWSASSKMIKETAHGVRAGNVGALSTLGSFPPNHLEKEKKKSG
jgi:hypothetical protein